MGGQRNGKQALLRDADTTGKSGLRDKQAKGGDYVTPTETNITLYGRGGFHKPTSVGLSVKRLKVLFAVDLSRRYRVKGAAASGGKNA